METHRNPCSVTLTTQIAVSFCIPACKRGESTCDVMASTKVFTVPHSAILVAKLTGKLQSVSARLDFILILLYVYVYKYVYIYIYVYTALYNDVCINILYRYRYIYICTAWFCPTLRIECSRKPVRNSRFQKPKSFRRVFEEHKSG